jgi:hypothetical protein
METEQRPFFFSVSNVSSNIKQIGNEGQKKTLLQLQ